MTVMLRELDATPESVERERMVAHLHRIVYIGEMIRLADRNAAPAAEDATRRSAEIVAARRLWRSTWMELLAAETVGTAASGTHVPAWIALRALERAAEHNGSHCYADLWCDVLRYDLQCVASAETHEKFPSWVFLRGPGGSPCPPQRSTHGTAPAFVAMRMLVRSQGDGVTFSVYADPGVVALGWDEAIKACLAAGPVGAATWVEIAGAQWYNGAILIPLREDADDEG